MSTEKLNKLNSLITQWPNSTVFSCSYLHKQGFSYELLKRYRNSGWLKTIGRGALAKMNDPIEWTGGLYAIQEQLQLSIFPAAKTALELQGSAHFISTGEGHTVFLFGSPKARLPGWFKEYDWNINLTYTTPNLFPKNPNLGITEKSFVTFKIRLSSRERAILEALHLVPYEQEFEEAYLLMENLRTLRPTLIQELLESCNSIKVKRLFLYLAEATNQPWFSKINLSQVDIGKGKRVIAEGGQFISKYNISVPKLGTENSALSKEGK